MGAVSVCTAHATTSSTSRVARRPTYGTPRCHPLAPGPGRRSCGHLRTVQVSGKASRAKSSVLQRSSLSLVMATASTTSSHEMTRPMPSDLTKERRFTQHSVVSIVGSGLARCGSTCRPVSSPRPSNRACGSPAHGSPTPFTAGIRFYPPGPEGSGCSDGSLSGQVDQPELVRRAIGHDVPAGVAGTTVSLGDEDRHPHPGISVDLVELVGGVTIAEVRGPAAQKPIQVLHNPLDP
jgi:hypothetical protein